MRARDKLTAKVEDLTMTVKDLDAATKVLKAEVADMKDQMKRAGEDREIANKDYQLTVADQRATKKLLEASLNVLKGFYGAALVQTGQEDNLEQPAFKKFEKNEKSGGIMRMNSSSRLSRSSRRMRT